MLSRVHGMIQSSFCIQWCIQYSLKCKLVIQVRGSWRSGEDNHESVGISNVLDFIVSCLDGKYLILLL